MGNCLASNSDNNVQLDDEENSQMLKHTHQSNRQAKALADCSNSDEENEYFSNMKLRLLPVKSTSDITEGISQLVKLDRGRFWTIDFMGRIYFWRLAPYQAPSLLASCQIRNQFHNYVTAISRC